MATLLQDYAPLSSYAQEQVNNNKISNAFCLTTETSFDLTIFLIIHAVDIVKSNLFVHFFICLGSHVQQYSAL